MNPILLTQLMMIVTLPVAPPLAVDSLSIAARLASEANTRINQEDYAGAVPLAREAAGIRERALPDGSDPVAESRAQLGRALGDLGEYGAAVPLLRRAFEVVGRPPIRDSVLAATLLNSLGRIHGSMGNLKDGRAELERSVDMLTALRMMDTRTGRIALTNLAANMAKSRDLKAARATYELLLAALDRESPIDSSRVATVLNNLGNVVGDLDDTDSAQRYLERALAIRRAVYGPLHPRVALILNNLAALAAYVHADSLALVYATDALSAFSDAWPDHPLRGELHVSRGTLLGTLGRWPEAFEEAMQGEAMTREHLRLTAQSLTETDALNYELNRLSGLHVAIAAIGHGEHGSREQAAMSERVLDAIVRSRAMLLDEAMQRSRLAAAPPDSLHAAIDEARRAAGETLSRLVLRSPSKAAEDSTYGAKVSLARQRLVEAETRWAAASAARRGVALREQLGLADVRAALPPDGALISFVRDAVPDAPESDADSARYIAFVTRATGDVIRIPIGRASEVDHLISRWRRALSPAASRPLSTEATYRSMGTRLRNRIWDPLETALTGARQVFIVPDAAISLVSFHALPTTAGRYLVETGPTLHYLSCERDLNLAEGHSAPRGALLAIGGVDFGRDTHAQPRLAPAGRHAVRDGSSDCDAFLHRRFGALPMTTREIDEVSALWSKHSTQKEVGAVRRSGALATEAEFKRLAPGCEGIHLATHAFFVDKTCLHPEGAQLVDPHDVLIRCGLVLAGANRHATDSGGDDGLLTAEEVSGLDLSRVRWVVLSACGSGLGDVVAGEGVFGLRRAFQTAGAATLIMSLWDVDDVATRRWMRGLYTARMLRGLPVAESVRSASIGVLAELRRNGSSTHPWTWAAFVASGDWR